MPRGKESVTYGGRNMIPAALGQQVAAMGASSDRIREAATQREAQAKLQGKAALGAGIARGVELGVQGKQRKEEMAQQREMHDEEIYQQHLDRTARQNMAVDMETSLNRRFLAGRAMDKAEKDLDFTRRKEMADDAAIADFKKHYITTIGNTKQALYEYALQKGRRDEGFKLTERWIDALDRQSEHERVLVEPVTKRQNITTDKLITDLDADMYKDIPEGGIAPGSKLLNDDLDKTGVNIQQFISSDAAAMEMVKNKTVTPAEVAQLMGILNPWETRLVELLGPVKKAAKEKEVKGFVGRRIPFEGPLSEAEIKRRIEAEEEDPWYEKLAGLTSFGTGFPFVQKYEMEVPSDPSAARQQALIMKDLEKVRKLKETLLFLSTSKEAKGAMLIGKEGKETRQSVADVIEYIGKPMNGLGYGSFVARLRAKYGDDEDTLSRGLFADFIKFQQSIGGWESLPKHLQERARKEVEEMGTFKVTNKELDHIFNLIQKQQGRTDPRAYEAAGGRQ